MVVNAYLITFGGLLLLAGRLGDLAGRKRVFMAGLGLFTLASLLCGVAQSQEMLVAARFVQGVGGALTSAVILGMIVTMFPEPREQAKAIGVYIPAEWRDQHSRGAAKRFSLHAADLHRHRLSADWPYHCRQHELHDLGHRVSGYLFHRARTAHVQVRNGPPARSARHRQSGEPDRLLCVHHHRYRFFCGRGGNALASLLLGQVNAFSIDIQNQALQERAHIAEFFAGDDWKVSDRLTLNLGTRYTLNFPSTEANNQTAVFNLNTQVLDFPHTARELECCDFGPRVGSAYRIGELLGHSLRLWNGLVRTDRHHDTFYAAAVPVRADGGATVAGQYQSGVYALKRADGSGDAPNPNSGLGQGVFGVDRNVGSGYSQQWNFTVQKTFGQI